jgi:hypothetical protein
MNNLEKIADELVEKFESYAQYNRLTGDGIVKAKVLCAIQSVNHAIGVLEELKKSIFEEESYLVVLNQLDEQLELKKILEQKS